MSSEESYCGHCCPAPSSSGHSSTYAPRADSSQAPVTHIRMGRGVVSVARYEKSAPKKKRPPADILVPFTPNGPDPASPVEISPGGTKRKWYRTSILRRRNTSLSGIVYPPNFVAETCPVSGDDQPRLDPWEEGEQAGMGEAGPGPSTLAARQAPILDIPSPPSEPSSPRMCDVCLARTPSTTSSSLQLPNMASYSRRGSVVSTIIEYPKDSCPEEEDESARAQLEALGLGSASGSDSRAVQEHLEVLTPDSDIHRPAPINRPTIRPLPTPPRGSLAPGSPPLSFSKSHDTFADASPPQSGVPPPPYVAPQSAGYDQSQENAPTALRRKNEKKAVQRWIIENL